MSVDSANLNWERTSPVAVVFFLFNSARQIGVNALAAVAVVFAAFASASNGRKVLILSGLLAFAGIAVLSSVLQWLRFRFCITHDRVLVRSGVFNREELSVEFGRIQNVNIREPFYMRPFGLALLSIDTAGSRKKEIILGGIPKALATRLRNAMLSNSRVDDSTSVESTDSVTDKPVLLSRQSKDIVIYGLTANFMIWIAIAVGALFSTFDVGEEFGVWIMEHIDSFVAVSVIQEGLGVPAAVVIAVGALLVIFVLLPMISVLGALFRHYGYQLRLDGETFQKSSGLLTRFDESLKRHKIQAMVLKQNLVARFFKRTNMQLRVASAGSAVEMGELSMALRPTFQVPALSESELPVLVDTFFPGCEPEKVRFTRINRRRLGMVVLGWGVLPPLFFTTTILMLTVSWWFALMLPFVLAFAWLIVNQVWTKIGYAVVGDYGFIRKGFFGTETTVFPLFKVQRVDIRQTPGQRRKGLAQLSLHLGSHTLKIPYVAVEDAKKYRDLALYHVESSKRAWF
ncbi:MAG: PH domain-containing protein [Lysobacterales bacterium]